MLRQGRYASILAVLIALISCNLACTGLPAPTELIGCLREPRGSNRTTEYSDFVDGRPSRLKLQAGWWSERPAAFSDVTLITAATVSRLDQLEAQCRAWRGPLVAAVYFVQQSGAQNGSALQQAEDDLGALHAKLEADPDTCALNAMLLVETVAERNMRWLLPINTLRNYALLAARSTLIMMLDVDLLPSASLSQWLERRDNMDWLKRESAEKRVFVLPAFETAPLKDLVEAHTVAARAAASDKAGLQALVKDGKLWQFALKIFREGHNVTEYARWFNTSEAYGPLKVTRDYEPWFIADRRSLPFWDGVFRGYGWNKVTHVTNTHQSGFDFFVHPEGFLVHRQHGHSASSSLYQKSKTAYEATLKKDQARAARDTSLAATTHKFRNRMLEQLRKGSYRPTLDAGVKGCLARLPWWRHGTWAAEALAPPSSPAVPQTKSEQPPDAAKDAAVHKSGPSGSSRGSSPGGNTAAGGTQQMRRRRRLRQRSSQHGLAHTRVEQQHRHHRQLALKPQHQRPHRRQLGAPNANAAQP